MPLQMIRNDISRISADAIVNTANPYVRVGAGTDRAVYERAGWDRLLEARAKIGILQPGEVAYTDAFGLDAKFIFHAVSPVWKGGNYGEAELVKNCYEKSLQLAKGLSCESIAFPLLATGSYGFPKEEALQIALSSIREFLTKEEMLVYVVVFDEESFDLSGKIFGGIDAFIDTHYVEEKIAAEYEIPYPEPDRLRGAPDFPSAKAAKPKLPEASDAGSFALPQMPAGAAAPSMPKKPNRFRKRNVRPSMLEPLCSMREETPPRESGPKAERLEYRHLDDAIAQLGENFRERLLRLIDERGYSDVEVYKKANLDRKLFSKIRCNPDYKPKKKTALALAIALELNLDDTKDLLARAELALSPGSKSDLIVEYFIRQRVYDIYTINVALFAHGQPTLGD